MSRRFLVITVILALGATACAGGEATPTIATASTSTGTEEAIRTVTSADGRVSVEVADAASEITVERLEVDGLGLPAELTVYGAYDLGAIGYDGGGTVTVATGIPWGESLPIVVGLLGAGDGRWEAIRTAAVGSVDGELTIAFGVPRFSPLVLVRTPFALDIDPPDVLASVGEHWDAFWDLVDPSVARAIDGPAMRTYFHGLDTDRAVVTSVRPLLEGVSVTVRARSDGAVAVVSGGAESGSYAAEPAVGFGFDDPDGPLTEVFYGYDTFTCVSPGAGVYGFTVELDLDDPSLLIDPTARTGVAFAEPTGGIRVRYDIAGSALCEEHPYVPLSRFLQGYLGFSASQVSTVLRSITADTGGPVPSTGGAEPGRLGPTVDLWDSTGIRYRETDQLRLDLDFNSSGFDCGTTVVPQHLNGLIVTTVCAEDAIAFPTGDVVLVAGTFMGALPRTPDAHYTFAAVFESDGDPFDDRVPQSESDLYQGTDRWYEASWDPDTGEWRLVVTHRGIISPSAARVLIFGDTIVWMIPAVEFASGMPAYRVTSFVLDGSSETGDVSGDDPTVAPVPVTVLAP